jgi:hypothetical protein
MYEKQDHEASLVEEGSNSLTPKQVVLVCNKYFLGLEGILR